MFNFNVMPYKRSGRTGGKSVSMVSMLVLLLAALLVLPSCFGTDTETVTETSTETVTQTTTETVIETITVIVEPPPSCDALGQTEGNDSNLGGSVGPDYICGLGGNDTITAQAGDDLIDGGEGDDLIDGGEGEDQITGGAGKDTIDGGPNDDMIDAGAGDDTIIGGPGDDLIDGGEGIDTAQYIKTAGELVGVNVNLQTGTANDGTYGRDELTNVENVTCLSTATIPSQQQLTAVTIVGDGEDNVLTGCDGDDTLSGGGGNDTLYGNDGTDTLDGGEGYDTASYARATAVVTVDLSMEANEDGMIATGGDLIATYADPDDDTVRISSIENVVGGTEADMITGNAENNALTGGPGTDTLNGGDGNDVLMGGPDGVTAAIDTLNGGDGNDTLYGDLAAIEVLTGGNGDDTFKNVDNNDTINEIVDTAATLDVHEGGMDTVMYAIVKERNDETKTGVTDRLPDNVETALGTQYDDTLTASTGGGAVILGLEGDDVLIGDDGEDVLVGCAGEDTLTGDGGDDVFGVFMGDEVDIIGDFARIAGNMDEVHLKGYPAGAKVTVDLVENSETNVEIKVDATTVAMVTGGTDVPAITLPSGDTPTAAQNMQAALLGSNEDGHQVTRIVVEFDDAKCSSAN